MIALERDGWALSVLPRLGGSIGRLILNGRDVLRPTPADAADILQAACFPLVPYANRIDHGRFSFDGREVILPVHDRFAPHALHGEGWLRPWSVIDRTDASISLVHRHEGGAWPWPYEAVQTFALTGSGLRVDLSVRNTGEAPMPAGLGLHPAFPVGRETRLTLTAGSVWAVDDGLIPTARVSAARVLDWSAGPRVAGAPFVDHCYAGWDGAARLAEPGRTIGITASPNAGWAHVYVPGQGFCCVEPVTHRPDAVHAPDDEAGGLARLAPGQALAIWMEITARDTAPSA